MSSSTSGRQPVFPSGSFERLSFDILAIAFQALDKRSVSSHPTIAELLLPSFQMSSGTSRHVETHGDGYCARYISLMRISAATIGNGSEYITQLLSQGIRQMLGDLLFCKHTCHVSCGDCQINALLPASL
ncbi:hypothetical protein DTO166G4_7976 [Paecilomyces variotii]|nr:hypothetical protein DTO166G4_7976 [Paecilomyces variotii]KAJ9229765.1 hypothetical protein DTO166G5_7687 [Paecilomyces variotii]KAJ9244803.1 hypothetical protein DTO169E5_1184 [Paecilomyces variotii]KAJ9376626.1 hypothetical protein DTO063F5_8705 [Paecilomyces variotii]KAJ9394742.1 hypothetical protein DTO282F9_8308 [Paecilomyces variotii]